MEFCKAIITFVVDILKYTLGDENFGSTLLMAPFVFWFIRQIIIMFKKIFRVNYS